MKKIYSLIVFTLMLTNLSAQVPQKMSYQAVIRNANNQLIQNNTVGMRLSILSGSSTGTAVYIETHVPITNGNGSVTVEIGSGTVVSGVFSNIDWSTGLFWLQTEVDPQGASSYSITGVSQLLSVPYAFYAKTAENLSNGNSGFLHFVGEEYQGGVIFHVYKGSDNIEHGLIVSLNDLASQIQWGLSGINVPNCESTWDGLSNSNAIASAGGLSSEPAGLCLAYTNQGFDDWYLPSIDEINLLFNSCYFVNNALNLINGATTFTTNFYWTSTEDISDISRAWNIRVGAFGNASKTFTGGVRAIRKF